MKKLLSIFLFLFCLASPVAAIDYTTTATIYLTNSVGTTNGDKLTIFWGALSTTNGYTNAVGGTNGITYTWTNLATVGIRQLAATNTAAKAATNLYTKLKADYTNKLTVTYASATAIRLQTYVNGFLLVTNSIGWATNQVITNALGTNLTLVVSNVNAKTMTLNNVTITDWTSLYTNGVGVPSNAGSSTNQSLYGPSFFGNSTNGLWVTWTNANGGLVTSNTVTGAVSTRGTNGAFSITGAFSGSVSRFTNGYWTNGILDKPLLTNSVNYVSTTVSNSGAFADAIFNMSNSDDGSVSEIRFNRAGTQHWTITENGNSLAFVTPFFGQPLVLETNGTVTINGDIDMTSGGTISVNTLTVDTRLNQTNSAGFTTVWNGSSTATNTNSFSFNGARSWDFKTYSNAFEILNVSSNVVFKQTQGGTTTVSNLAVNSTATITGLSTLGPTLVSSLTNSGASTLTGAVNIGGVLTATNAALYSATLITPSFSNSVFTSSNTVSGGWAYTRTNNTGLANGSNAGVDPGTGAGSEKTYMKVSGPTAAFTINGMAGGRDGRIVIIQNSTGYTLTVANDSGIDPVAANRIYTGKNADITVTNNPGFVQFIYDSAASRWGVMSKSD